MNLESFFLICKSMKKIKTECTALWNRIESYYVKTHIKCLKLVRGALKGFSLNFNKNKKLLTLMHINFRLFMPQFKFWMVFLNLFILQKAISKNSLYFRYLTVKVKNNMSINVIFIKKCLLSLKFTRTKYIRQNKQLNHWCITLFVYTTLNIRN